MSDEEQAAEDPPWERDPYADDLPEPYRSRPRSRTRKRANAWQRALEVEAARARADLGIGADEVVEDHILVMEACGLFSPPYVDPPYDYFRARLNGDVMSEQDFEVSADARTQRLRHSTRVPEGWEDYKPE